MSVINECLNKIIGLSETNCSCFTNDIPVDAATSRSGLFLDQLEGINLKLVDAVEDCEEGGLWDILAKSRDNAIKDFKSDLASAMLQRYKYKRQPFTGIIGTQKFKNTLSIGENYAGVEFYLDEILGGTMEVRRIGLLFSQTVSFTIYVYGNADDQLLASYSVTSAANQLTWYDLPTPLQLAMSNNSGENPRYYFIYELADAAQPKDNQAGCGCSSSVYKYYWDCRSPRFPSYEKDRWSEYLMQTGVQGNSIPDRDNWTTTNYMNGLMFDVAFKCAVKDLICTEVPDYANNELALVMAYAVRYKAGQLLIDKVLASGNISRFTMMDRERLMGKKNTYVKEYLQRIDYLAAQINHRQNDCLICNDTDDIFKSGILS